MACPGRWSGRPAALPTGGWAAHAVAQAQALPEGLGGEHVIADRGYDANADSVTPNCRQYLNKAQSYRMRPNCRTEANDGLRQVETRIIGVEGA